MAATAGGVAALRMLKTLKVDGNELTELPAGFTSMAELQVPSRT